jgi:DNA-binding PucR family transcriptional regulator
MRIEEIRSDLAARLRSRLPEIEEAAITRVFAVSDPRESSHPEYAEGLRAAILAALRYGIEALQRREDRAPPIPTTLLSQARLAARSGIKLETVLRRYLAGYTVLGDFVIEEAERGGPISSTSLQRLSRAQASLFDRLIAAVSEEYGRESESRLLSPERLRAERVRSLLAGEILDAPELAYELDGRNHLGVIVAGCEPAEALGELAKGLDRRLLLVRPEQQMVWGWLGSRHSFSSEQLERLAAWRAPIGATVAIGEPGEGLAGWRLSHRQARAALPVALRGGQGFVRYGEVALLASMVQDDLLTVSLRQLYLEPLEAGRDSGATLRETLRAYFAAGRNSSSAAAALGVSGRTVANRLRAIEARLGRELGADMEVALRLDELEGAVMPVSKAS